MTALTVHPNGSSTTASTQAEVTLGRIERIAGGVVVALVVLLGVIGAVNSFRAVAEAVEPSFDGLAWTVPLGVDVGIAVFTALDLLLARLGMRMSWLRLVPWALVATTIYLNVAGEHNPVAAVAHGVLPGLWVVAVEAGSHVIRRHVGLTGPGGVERMDRVRWSRCLLAPVSTLQLWRRMVLWETRSYSDALRRERHRVLACTDLQDRWGRWAWRWRAPRRARVLYRLGELVPAAALPTAPATDPAPTSRRPSTRTTRKRSRPASDLGELADAGRVVADELAAEGARLTRGALAERLRARGVPVSNARLSALLAELRTATARPRTAEEE
ncbi:MAG TPA: DUF2637 domain-containing protein [Acidimicrobiales bacterium]|nr:DUF2637 domain-containing protein [Acidimicrobiales bacterium]